MGCDINIHVGGIGKKQVGICHIWEEKSPSIANRYSLGRAMGQTAKAVESGRGFAQSNVR